MKASLRGGGGGENPSEEVVEDYYEQIARNDGFSRAPEIDLRYETKASDSRLQI